MSKTEQERLSEQLKLMDAFEGWPADEVRRLLHHWVGQHFEMCGIREVGPYSSGRAFAACQEALRGAGNGERQRMLRCLMAYFDPEYLPDWEKKLREAAAKIERKAGE